MPGNTGRARRQQSLRQYQTGVLSGGGEERHPVRLSRPRRAAGASACRLLRRARQPHLRLQGDDRLQLAAIFGSRRRPGAHLVPASLLRGRRSDAELRQGVPRHHARFRHADVAHHARIPGAAYRGGADRLRLSADDVAADQRRQHARARDQSHVPQRLRHSDEPGHDDHAVACADRRRQALLVRDLHFVRRRR